MSYAIDPAVAPGREIVRVIRQQRARLVEACEMMLRDPASLSRSAFVHRARVRGKKIRAALLLGRELMGDKAYRKQNRWWRDVARGLSDIRDQSARLEALEALRTAIEPELGRSVTVRLQDRFESERAASESSAEGGAAVKTFCEHILAHGAPHADLCKAGDAEDVAEALADAYRAARKAMNSAMEEPSPEAFHEWRKRMKAHLLEMRMARRLFPDALEPQIESARDLSDVLGGLQDIEVLSHALEGEGDARVLELLNVRRSSLEAAALEAGSQLYADGRKAWAAHLVIPAGGGEDGANGDDASVIWRASREAS